MGRRLASAVAAVILVVSVAAILMVIMYLTARQAVPLRAPFVTAMTVMSGEGLIPIHGRGTVHLYVEVNVTTEVSGRVVWVNLAFQNQS